MRVRRSLKQAPLTSSGYEIVLDIEWDHRNQTEHFAVGFDIGRRGKPSRAIIVMGVKEATQIYSAIESKLLEIQGD